MVDKDQHISLTMQEDEYHVRGHIDQQSISIPTNYDDYTMTQRISRILKHFKSDAHMELQTHKV